MNQKYLTIKSNFIIWLLSILVIIALVIIFSQVKNQKTRPDTLLDDAIVSIGYENSFYSLAFDEAKLQVKVPRSLLNFTDEELSHFNNSDVDNEYYLWRACRSIFKETNMDFMLWVSFDEQDKLCGTERTMALLAESEYQDYGNNFCDNLESVDRFPFQQYYGCEGLTSPPKGFQGYFFYEFIGDYGVEDSGTIVKEIFLVNEVESENKIILGYFPNEEKRLNIKPSEFTDYVGAIKNGKYEIFNSTNENMKIFEEIVRSLEEI